MRHSGTGSAAGATRSARPCHPSQGDLSPGEGAGTGQVEDQRPCHPQGANEECTNPPADTPADSPPALGKQRLQAAPSGPRLGRGAAADQGRGEVTAELTATRRGPAQPPSSARTPGTRRDGEMGGWRDGGTEGRMLTGVHTGAKEGAPPPGAPPSPHQATVSSLAPCLIHR